MDSLRGALAPPLFLGAASLASSLEIYCGHILASLFGQLEITARYG
jgi:hypothetical protein